MAGRLLRAPAGSSTEDAVPAPDVALKLDLYLEGSGKPFDGELTTDERGEFRITLENPEALAGSVKVDVRAGSGYQWVTNTIPFDAGEMQVTGIVVLQYAFADLTGLVTDTQDAPLGGVTVSFKDAGRPREAVSDEQGRFHLEGVRSPLDFGAQKPGWMPLSISSAFAEPDGRWRPLRILMGSTATLRVEVRDAAGEPIPGRWVRAEISPVEPLGAAVRGWAPFEPPTPTAETDAVGVAVLEGVAAGRRLRVVLSGHEYEWQRASDGLLLESDEGGSPLVLMEGEQRDAHVTFGTPVSIRGRVFEPDGSPSPSARVAVRALDVFDEGRAAHLGSVRTNEHGSFAFKQIPDATTRRVVVTAAGTIGEKPSLSMFGGTAPPDPLHAGWAIVELPDSGEYPRELELSLEIMQSIGGQVLNPEGNATRARVELHPLEPGPFPDTLASGMMRARDTGDDGQFLLKGVPPGLYDVEVAGSAGRARAQGVQAGETGLVIQLAGEASAQVEIEVSSDLELKQIIVLRARLDPLDESTLSLTDLPRSATYEDPFGWPEAALGLWYGAQSYHGELGRAMFSSGPIEGSSTSYEISEGLYWIGAKATTTDGVLCFPIGTGLVRVGPGEHKLRFHLEATGKIEGQVIGAAPGANLSVAAAFHDGRLIPLDVRREEVSGIAGLAADGSFKLNVVPARRLELRVGTTAELAAGRFTARQMLQVEAGETTRVDIEL